MKIQGSILVKSLAIASFVGILIFTILVIILHLLRPQMAPLRHTVSEYAIGPFGYLMTIAFIMRGLGEAFLVIGLMLGTSSMRGNRSWVGLVLLTLAAVCSFLVAIFPGNMQNARELLIHSLSAFVGFASLILAALVWSRRFRKNPGLRKSATTILILGLLMLFSLIGFLVGPRGFPGLTERFLEIFITCWLCFMAWRLFTFVDPKWLI